MKLNVTAHRTARKESAPPAYRYSPMLELSPRAHALVVAAQALKSERIFAGVSKVLLGAIDNADDTVVDGFDDYAKTEYGTREAFWAVMFVGSAAGLTCERDVPASVRRFFNSRGIIG